LGTTIDIERRQTELEQECETRLQLVWHAPGGFEEEQALLRRFSGWRVGRGEWVWPSRELESFIGRPLIPAAPSPTGQSPPPEPPRIMI
jgi:hypothetical protein